MSSQEYIRHYVDRKYASDIKELLQRLNDLPCKRFYIKSHDGKKLSSRYFESAPGAPIDLLMAGYKSDSGVQFCNIIPLSLENGHNVLLIDQRACGQSEGHIVTFGVQECHDCLDWLKFISKKWGNQTPVYLHGKSMGASAALMASPSMPENVKCIISEDAYSSFEELLRFNTRNLRFPFKILYPFIRIGASVFGRLDIDSIVPAETVPKSKVPVVFIHGYCNGVVPYTMCGALSDACCSTETVITFNLSNHGLCSLCEEEKYKSALKDVYSYFSWN